MNRGANINILEAHRHSARHRIEIKESEMCGCFYCLEIFLPQEIEDWVDWPQGTPADQELDMGTTALCPKCGIDSVLGSKSGFPITSEFLAKMKEHWFET
jgi:hypothetical protein